MDTRPIAERISSRRFILSLVVAVIVTIGEKFGVDLDPEQLLALVGLAASYNLKDIASK